MVKLTDPERLHELLESHGVKTHLIPEYVEKQRGTETERLARQQADTIAQQWMVEWAKMEVTSRTCLFCNFAAKSRNGLRAHLVRTHKAEGFSDLIQEN